MAQLTFFVHKAWFKDSKIKVDDFFLSFEKKKSGSAKTLEEKYPERSLRQNLTLYAKMYNAILESKSKKVIRKPRKK